MLEDSIPLISCAAGADHQSTNMFVHKNAPLASCLIASSPPSHVSLNGMPPFPANGAASNELVFATSPRMAEAMTPGPQRRALRTPMQSAIFPTPPQVKLHPDAMEPPSSFRASGVADGDRDANGHRNGTVPGGAGSAPTEGSISIEAKIEAKLEHWPDLMLPSRLADSLLAVKGQANGRYTLCLAIHSVARLSLATAR